MTAREQILFCFLGFCYGAVLFVSDFFTVGIGEGTYVPTAIAASPLTLLGFRLAFFGVPALWAVVGFLLGRLDRRAYRTMFLIAMAVHYLGIIPGYLSITAGIADIDAFNFKKIWNLQPGLIVAALMVYLIGQVAIWITYSRYKPRRG